MSNQVGNPIFPTIDARSAPAKQTVDGIRPEEVEAPSLEPVDLNDIGSPETPAEQSPGRSLPKLTPFQKGLLLGGGVLSVATTMLGGGGVPDPDTLTETAHEAVMKASNHDNRWNETESLVEISRRGVKTPEQLEIIERAADEAGRVGWLTGDSWDGGHEVVVTALGQEDLGEVHIDTVDTLLGRLDGEGNFDETEGILATLRADNLNPEHNRLAVVIDQAAQGDPNFVYGNELLEAGLRNSRLGREQVDAIQALIGLEGHHNPHLHLREAALTVAQASGFGSPSRDLVETIAEAAIEQTDWTAANALIAKSVATELSEQKAKLSQVLLGAQDFEGQGVARLIAEVLESRGLEANQLDLSLEVGRSLADHQWNPGPTLTLIRQQDGLSPARLRLGQKVLRGLDSEDRFQTVSALTTVLEAEDLREGPQTEAMEAVLEKAFDDREWADGNRLFRFLSTKPNLTSQEARAIRERLDNPAIDAYAVIVAALDNQASEQDLTQELVEELEAVDREVLVADYPALSVAQNRLVDVFSSAPDRLDYAEGGGSPILTQALSNPELSEASVDLLDSMVTKEELNPDRQPIALLVASAPALSDVKAEAIGGLNGHFPSPELVESLINNQDFGSDHLELIQGALATQDSSLGLAIEAIAEAGPIAPHKMNLARQALARDSQPNGYSAHLAVRDLVSHPVEEGAATEAIGHALATLEGESAPRVLRMVIQSPLLANNPETLELAGRLPSESLMQTLVENPRPTSHQRRAVGSLTETGSYEDQAREILKSSGLTSDQADLVEAVAEATTQNPGWRGGGEFLNTLLERPEAMNKDTVTLLLNTGENGLRALGVLARHPDLNENQRNFLIEAVQSDEWNERLLDSVLTNPELGSTHLKTLAALESLDWGQQVDRIIDRVAETEAVSPEQGELVILATKLQNISWRETHELVEQILNHQNLQPAHLELAKALPDRIGVEKELEHLFGWSDIDQEQVAFLSSLARDGSLLRGPVAEAYRANPDLNPFQLSAIQELEELSYSPSYSDRHIEKIQAKVMAAEEFTSVQAETVVALTASADIDWDQTHQSVAATLANENLTAEQALAAEEALESGDVRGMLEILSSTSPTESR